MAPTLKTAQRADEFLLGDDLTDVEMHDICAAYLAALKDAERYRWLRDRTREAATEDEAPFIARSHGGIFSMWTKEDADKAVDQAMGSLIDRDQTP